MPTQLCSQIDWRHRIGPVTKAVLEQRGQSGHRTIWFDVSSFESFADFGAFEASLLLRNSLGDLFAKEVGAQPLIILKGIDRLYKSAAFRIVASLLQLAQDNSQSTPWHVLAVCQTAEWTRVVDELRSVVARKEKWFKRDTARMKPTELRPIAQANPQLARLLRHPSVGPLLTNLKIPDLVVHQVREGTEIPRSDWVGECSIVEWFWEAEVARGREGLSRVRVMRELAQAQADNFEYSMADTALEASLLPAAELLIGDQLLIRVPHDRIAFAHDLYGDWARLRILLSERDNLVPFFQTRRNSPRWSRAIRLLGISLLEGASDVPQYSLASLLLRRM